MLAFAITTSMTLALGIFTIVRASHSVGAHPELTHFRR